MADLDADLEDLRAEVRHLQAELRVWEENYADATTVEVERLRAAIVAIPRHAALWRLGSDLFDWWCEVCQEPWPCPTEQAHRMQEEDRG